MKDEFITIVKNSDWALVNTGEYRLIILKGREYLRDSVSYKLSEAFMSTPLEYLSSNLKKIFEETLERQLIESEFYVVSDDKENHTFYVDKELVDDARNVLGGQPLYGSKHATICVSTQGFFGHTVTINGAEDNVEKTGEQEIGCLLS